jgi:hypothetical protein
MTFETVEKNRKSFAKFHLFGKSFGCEFSCFTELLDFSKSCLPESSAMRNFNKVEFSDAISRKFTWLRFLHRWMSFMLFLATAPNNPLDDALVKSWDKERTQTRTCKVHQLEEVDMLNAKIDLLMKKLENLGLNHLKKVDARVTCEECG